jgi:transcriptional regulator with XRE-family HTH domain
MSNGNELDTPSPDTDDAFARAFKSARERSGKTQEQIVREMNDRGFANFHQVTIYKIEKGDRKVAVGEAAALALTVDETIVSIFDDPENSRSARQNQLKRAALSVREAIDRAHDPVEAVETAQRELQDLVERFRAEFEESTETPEFDRIEALTEFEGASDFLRAEQNIGTDEYMARISRSARYGPK